MPKSRKRKTDNGGVSEELWKRPSVSCIVHASGIQHGYFTAFSNVRGSATDKLAQLHSIRDRRLAEPSDSPSRMEDVCNGIPESLVGADLEAIGYHRGCYQNFTKNQDRLKCIVESKEAPTSRSPRKLPPPCSTMQLFPPECIFCQTVELKVSRKTERCIKFAVFKEKDGTLKEPTWKQVEPRALELGNLHLHRMVQGEDLFAREAQFHQTCRRSFNLKYAKHMHDTAQATNRAIDTDQDCKSDAHQNAFSAVLDLIQERVIEQNEVVRLASLRLLYIQELERYGFPNPNFRGEKLKSRLESHDISEYIAFAKVNPGNKGFITYNLVYSASTSVADAVAFAYKLGSTDKYEDMALLLRSIIQRAYKESTPLPWPPTADDLEVKSSDEILPHELLKFLNFVISGEADMDTCEKTRRIVLSVGQV